MGVMETLTLEFRADLSGVDAQFALLTASLNALSSEEEQALAHGALCRAGAVRAVTLPVETCGTKGNARRDERSGDKGGV